MPATPVGTAVRASPKVNVAQCVNGEVAAERLAAPPPLAYPTTFRHTDRNGA